ncbi:hypothetical protein [Clostridium botulinum]|uniref:hypothetical protein n=1 Tax=Clostridium botulinum TaxID=1491 RepID=UPI000957A3C3|nr:hypothetical protein [Clostridium botulinum]APU60759.1 hypothetical protein NPD8_2718 [Clostridium botulinum]
MRKQKLLRMYAFDNADIQLKEIRDDLLLEDKYCINKTYKELKTNEIRISENELIRCYCLYTNKELKNDMLITDIIKVTLSDEEKKSREQVKGIRFNGIDYVSWFSSTGGMKEADLETHSQCEWYFIKKNIAKLYNQSNNFQDWFEYLISGGKIEDINELYMDKETGKAELSINKDILSRISLSTSGSWETNIIPKIIVLPECSHKVISDIVTIDVPNLREIEDYEVDTTPFDGCGLMSPNLALAIQKDLHVNYGVDFAVIRMYDALAVKGLVVKMDFISYFKEFYKYNTDLFYRKADGKFYTKDYIGEEQCLNNADLILNESQVKWAKWWKDDNGIEGALDRLQDKEFDTYRNTLSHLHITKINKNPEKLKDYILTNYQLMSNLAITPTEIDILSKDTEELYNKILEGDEDLTRIFWGDINNEAESDKDIDGNIIINEDYSMTTQAQKLLTINPEMINIAYVKRAVARMITKKIKLLASGKFYVRGSYQYVCMCPITMCDWIMNRKDNKLIKAENGLKAHQFYNTSVQNGEIRTASRCPLNSFSEVQNLTYTRNETLDKYLGKLTREIHFINAYDLTCQIMSGMDEDGDGNIIVDEEIIKSSVVEDLPFINVDDDKSKAVKMEYTPNNRIEATLKASGNLIGSLAFMGMSVNNNATEVPEYRSYKRIKTGVVYTYADLWQHWKIKKQDELKEKTYSKFLEVLDKKFEYVDIHNKHTEQEIKEHIAKQFHERKYDSYRLRNLQMEAIDAPKLLSTPTIPKWLKDKYKKKPRYLYYAKDYLRKDKTEYLDSAMDIHATRIARELLSKCYKNKQASDKVNILKKYCDEKEFAAYYKDEYEKCKTEIGNLYEDYKEKVIKSVYNLKVSEIKKSYKESIEELDLELKGLDKKEYAKKRKTQKETREKLKDTLEESLQDIKKVYLNLKLKAEMDINFEADEIIKRYKKELIAYSLVNLCNSETFIFKFFFAPVASVIEKNSLECKNYTYRECKDGEKEDVQYLHKKYKKIEIIRSAEEIEKLHKEGRYNQYKKLVKQLDGFSKEFQICGLKVDKFEFDKVIIKLETFIDRKTGMERETIKLYNNNAEIGFVHPSSVKIDEFTDLKDYKNKECYFKFNRNSGKSIKAIISYM